MTIRKMFWVRMSLLRMPLLSTAVGHSPNIRLVFRVLSNTHNFGICDHIHFVCHNNIRHSFVKTFQSLHHILDTGVNGRTGIIVQCQLSMNSSGNGIQVMTKILDSITWIQITRGSPLRCTFKKVFQVSIKMLRHIHVQCTSPSALALIS